MKKNIEKRTIVVGERIIHLYPLAPTVSGFYCAEYIAEVRQAMQSAQGAVYSQCRLPKTLRDAASHIIDDGASVGYRDHLLAFLRKTLTPRYLLLNWYLRCQESIDAAVSFVAKKPMREYKIWSFEDMEMAGYPSPTDHVRLDALSVGGGRQYWSPINIGTLSENYVFLQKERADFTSQKAIYLIEAVLADATVRHHKQISIFADAQKCRIIEAYDAMRVDDTYARTVTSRMPPFSVLRNRKSRRNWAKFTYVAAIALIAYLIF
ncbi:hypothetical protein AB4254_11795 [Vibrio breoganii]